MCIYKTAAVSGKKMEVSPTDNTNNATVGRFMVDIGFKGWRGIWVSYDECKESEESLSNKSIIEKVDFVLNHQDTIYIDSLEFGPSLAFQSRDKIVPPFTKFGSKYNYWDSWQKSYNWSQQLLTATPKDIDPSKISSLSHIESRLRNFYFDEKTTIYDFSGTVRNRWNAFKESINSAHTEYERLEFKTGFGKKVISSMEKEDSHEFNNNEEYLYNYYYFSPEVYTDEKNCLIPSKASGAYSEFKSFIKNNKIPEYAREYKREYQFIKGLNHEFRYFRYKPEDVSFYEFFHNFHVKRIIKLLKMFLRNQRKGIFTKDFNSLKLKEKDVFNIRYFSHEIASKVLRSNKEKQFRNNELNFRLNSYFAFFICK